MKAEVLSLLQDEAVRLVKQSVGSWWGSIDDVTRRAADTAIREAMRVSLAAAAGREDLIGADLERVRATLAGIEVKADSGFRGPLLHIVSIMVPSVLEYAVPTVQRLWQ